MSSCVNLDLCLIASKGLLPETKLHEVFYNTLNELCGTIKDNVLYIENILIGKITLKDRIIVQTYRGASSRPVQLLREAFTRRAEVAIKDYAYELEQEKERAYQSNLALEELNARIRETDKLKHQQLVAIERQNMDACEAIVAELKESAENQGYEIVEEKTEEGVQLQFVRRLY